METIPGGPKKYKAMKAKKDTSSTAKTGFPAPGDPYWKKHPLLTEHKDGTIRQWGEDTTKKVAAPAPAKKKADYYEGGAGNSGSGHMRYHQ